ncbi:MAG TPA: N-formylglutamate amidohydrolase [Solimonas sp.]|nr:N-formylglutamate amidohydrolase [Solimonas sp.]
MVTPQASSRTARPQAAAPPPANDTGLLLAPDEAPALVVERAGGASDFVLACDHAGKAIPRSLGTLGLSETELSSHIAWDIGAAGVARRLAERLDAALVLQSYSRLVIDCNRPLEAPDSIARSGDWDPIPGNDKLSDAAIGARVGEVFQPYHDGLRELLDLRQRERRQTFLVAIHSFTPTMRGTARPWHVGVMYRHDARLATALLKLLRRDERLVVGDNEPYAVEEASDYTLPVHGEARGIAHVGIEIRQDLVADEAGQKTWAGRLASMLKQAAEGLPAKSS